MADKKAVTIEAAEVPLLPADNKALYRDIDVAQNASQDEVLTAAVHSFYRLCGYDPSLTIAEPSDKVKKDDVLSKSATVLAAFSTLYDDKSRAAYDKFGDEMFKLLSIDSHAATEHPSNDIVKVTWKHGGLFLLASFLFLMALVGLFIYYQLPGRTIVRVVLASIFLFSGSVIFGTIRHLTQFLYLSSTGKIKQADPQLVSAIDPSREHLVRLYGSRLAFNWFVHTTVASICCLTYIVLAVVIYGGVDYIPRIHGYGYVPLIVAATVWFGAAISTFAHNSGYDVPHLDIFFHTVASRVSIDLPNLNAESRENLFELIDNVVLTARYKALEAISDWVVSIAGFTYMSLTRDSPGWFMAVFLVAYIGFTAITSAFMYLSKRHWSYAGYAK